MVNNKILWKVDTFLNKLNNGEYKILPQAYKLIYTDKGTNKSLGEWLYDAIDSYERWGGSLYSIVDDSYAQNLSKWVNIAFGKGVIADNSDLAKKLKEKDEQIVKLSNAARYWKKLAEKNATDLVYWQGRYDDLDMHLKTMFKNKDDIPR